MTRASLREYAAVQRERYLQRPVGREASAADRGGGGHWAASQGRPSACCGARCAQPRVAPARAARADTALPWPPRPSCPFSEATGPHRPAPLAPLPPRVARSPDPEWRRGGHARSRQAPAPGQPRHPRPPLGALSAHPAAPGSHDDPPRRLAQAPNPRPHTFAEWTDAQPGFLELDLVAHCGPTTTGFYLYTLCAVDVATTWVDLQAVWGKGQKRVGTAIHHVRQRLPIPLRGLDSDNGSEFINHDLYAWCQREGITFTRSRPYQKNDSAHVEQKNGAHAPPPHRLRHPRRHHASKAAYALLARAYDLARFGMIHLFRPVQQLVRWEQVPWPARASRVRSRPHPVSAARGDGRALHPASAGARGGVSAPEPAASSPSARGRLGAPLDLGGPTHPARKTPRQGDSPIWPRAQLALLRAPRGPRRTPGPAIRSSRPRTHSRALCGSLPPRPLVTLTSDLTGLGG